MELAEQAWSAIPTTVLTGFLGAGKTTLVNRIVTGEHGLRVAVIVNDFGSINIDAELVVGVDSDIVSLANGCVCCQIRDDLMAAVEGLLSRRENIDYILLEASGVAEPAGIFATFTDRRFRNRIRLDSVTCILDAEQAFAHTEYPAIGQLKLRQMAFADMVILNKIGLAGPNKVDAVRAWIDDHMNRVRIVEADFCNVPLEILLSVGRFDVSTRPQTDAACLNGPHHGHMFSTWSYESSRPLQLERLRETVRKLPSNIYRCKGVVFAVEEPHRRALLQTVGRRTDVTLEHEWGERLPRTQIVAIGAPGSIDADVLQRSFDSCSAESVAPQ